MSLLDSMYAPPAYDEVDELELALQEAYEAGISDGYDYALDEGFGALKNKLIRGARQGIAKVLPDSVNKAVRSMRLANAAHRVHNNSSDTKKSWDKFKRRTGYRESILKKANGPIVDVYDQYTNGSLIKKKF